MTERVDQLLHDNRHAHSTALVQAFFSKESHHPGLSAPLQSRFGFLCLTNLPRATFAFEREEICECDGHTVRKLSQRRLTAGWLAPRESDRSRIYIKVSSDWLPCYIKATQPVLEISKMTGYFPDSPRNIMVLSCNSLPASSYSSTSHIQPIIFIIVIQP
jgi:hypothetical protein